jgi:thiol-disulfide isomerase/thioredoxin
MARSSTQTKPGKGSKGDAASPSGGNRTVVFLLAGITALAVLGIVAFAVLSAVGGEDAGNFTPNDEGLLPAGSEAPGFTAETVEGEEVSVGDGSAGATMLVFFATWCPHCNNEAPIISDLEGQYEELRVVMIGIDSEDDPEKVRQFVERYDIAGPAVYQPSLGSTYQVTGYPTTYVLDGDDEVVAAHSGEAPSSVYEGWIEEAIASDG